MHDGRFVLRVGVYLVTDSGIVLGESCVVFHGRAVARREGVLSVLFERVFVVVQVNCGLFYLFFRLLRVGVIHAARRLIIFVRASLGSISFLCGGVVVFLVLIFKEEQGPSHRTAIDVR